YGYHVNNPSVVISPRLRSISSDLCRLCINLFDVISFTTDTSSPSITKIGLITICTYEAIIHGLPLEEAYRMGSYNADNHLKLDEVLGSIAPGKIANINVLYDKADPTPLSVLAKGEWMVKDGYVKPYDNKIDWDDYEAES